MTNSLGAQHMSSTAPAGASGSHTRPSTQGPNRERSLFLEFLVLIGIAFFLAFLVKTFLVQAFFIPSGSMENTLAVGDRVLVNKVVYHTRPIERGDIVVFDGLDSFAPEFTIPAPGNPIQQVTSWIGQLVGFAAPNERDFVKRVVGVGGDHVVCCDVQGRVSVNGVYLDETSYLFPGNSPSDVPFDITVPDGKLFVLGDHRAASSDSRAHLGDPGGGFVPVDRVIGRAFVILWPLQHAQVLPIPETYNQPGLARSGK